MGDAQQPLSAATPMAQVPGDPLPALAIDLSPILPGGHNGGAKPFVLELVSHWIRQHPDTRFWLLIHERAAEELQALERDHAHCLIVARSEGARTPATRIKATLRHGFGILPARLRRLLRQGLTWLRGQRGSRGHGSLLHPLGVRLLYCPFTAPTFREPGIPVVATVHDLQYRAYPQFFTPDDVRHRDHLFRQACQQADCLVAVSEYTRLDVLNQTQLPTARVVSIPTRLSGRFRVKEDPAGDEAVLNRLGLACRGYLIYPANFWRHKNHEMLFVAFQQALREGLKQGIRLVCTGEDDDRRRWLVRAVEGMGLTADVVFPGYLSETELARVMRQALGLVFPSLYEGFGMPLLEAMSAGIPVACGRVTSLPEVAGDAALYFDPRRPDSIAQALLTLASDEYRRRELIAKGFVQARAYQDTSRMADDYWRIFLSLAGPASSDRAGQDAR